MKDFKQMILNPQPQYDPSPKEVLPKRKIKKSVIQKMEELIERGIQIRKKGDSPHEALQI